MNADAEKFPALHNIVKAAREKLDDNAWDYLIGGADTETTVKRNRRALDCWAFRPRVLNDVRPVVPCIHSPKPCARIQDGQSTSRYFSPWPSVIEAMPPTLSSSLGSQI